jgi:copper chaperone CopZ
VQSALESVPGVTSASVDYDAKTATVVCEGHCDMDAMVAALEDAGYDARRK